MSDTFYSKIRQACVSKGTLYVKTVRMVIEQGECRPPEGYSVQDAIGVIDAAMLDFRHAKLQRDAKKKVKKAKSE